MLFYERIQEYITDLFATEKAVSFKLINKELRHSSLHERWKANSH
jgi:hypothetical protein